MQRGSDKHASRLDEALEHDTRSVLQGQPVEARAEEHREQEGPADGEPTPDARLTGGRLPSDPLWPTDDELEARSELARHLDPSAFPAEPQELKAVAERNQAAGWVLDVLTALPEGTYATTEEVWLALGGSREQRT